MRNLSRHAKYGLLPPGSVAQLEAQLEAQRNNINHSIRRTE